MVKQEKKSKKALHDPEIADIENPDEAIDADDPKAVTEEKEIEELLPSAKKTKKSGNHIDDILIEMEEERGNWD